MTAIVLQGNAASLQLPDGSVDLIVTSPPYFGLRSYQDGGEHLPGQVGAEDTPEKYLDALIVCTAEWVRVLKPGGSIFVNLGDKYASYEGNRGRGGDVSGRIDPGRNVAPKGAGLTGGGFVRSKSLMLLPQRYAIRCIDELGLILRAEIVWAKPNGLPESVTDRVRRAHEQVFHFVKQPRYYSAVDEVREPHGERHGGGRSLAAQSANRATGLGRQSGLDDPERNPLGKLPGSVWEIPTAPLKVPASLGIDHFAAYPPELVRRIVLGWSPREVCTACGEGRRPTTEGTPMLWRESPTAAGRNAPGTSRKSASGTMLAAATRTITGYACACPDTDAPATPGVVLDPFGGTGTTALVASVHGRVGISVDLSADYCRLARWRTSDEKQRAKAARPPKQSYPGRNMVRPGPPGDGDTMTQTLEPASVAAPRPELDWERDGNGRPRILPDPTWDDVTRQKWQAGRAWDDGTVGYTRVTTFAEALQDSSALTRWKMRREALGFGRRPDYVTAAAALSLRDEDRDALDDLAEKALEAAGPNAADVGTALHSFTERIDRGEELGAVPQEYVATLEAYRRVVAHLRFVEFECRTVCDELETAGTPDRMGFCDVPDPDGVVDELRVIDTKTGRVDYSAGKFSTQLAIYRRSRRYHPGTGARTSWEELHGAPVSRWGIVVHVPAGAGTAELLWLNLEHGDTGAELAGHVRQWRTGATAGALLQPVFARPPRPATADGTCRGRKQDGRPCGYRTRASGRHLDELERQFCGRHHAQAADLARWLAENPDADPADGLEQLPSAEPVQPSFPPVQLEDVADVAQAAADDAQDRADRAAQEAAAARSVAAQLERREQLLRRDDEGDEAALHEDAPDDAGPDEEEAADVAAASGEYACPWCSDTGCSVCQPEQPQLTATAGDVAARAFAGAQAASAAAGELQRPARELDLPPEAAARALEAAVVNRADDLYRQELQEQRNRTVGTYALDPEREQNGNRRPVAGLQTEQDAAAMLEIQRANVVQELEHAQTEGELHAIYLRRVELWTDWLTAVAGRRSLELGQQRQRERPEAALLAALEHAPDTGTLHRLFLQYGGGDLWTPAATAAAQQRWEQLAGR